MTIDLFNHQGTRFLLVGSVSAVMYFGLCFIGQAVFGWPAFAAALAAYALAFFATYFGHKHWSFKSAGSHKRAFVRYAAWQAILGLSVAGGTHVIAVSADFSAFVVAVLSSLLAASLSYLVSANWVFRNG